jgi:diaminopimelate decarboxylase
MGKRAPIAFRVNPDVNPNTHPYISTGLRSNKFGVAFTEALDLYRKAAGCRHRDLGIDCHIGSQLLDPAPMAEAAGKILGLVDQLAREGIKLDHIDLGGGLGIRYRDEEPPTPPTTSSRCWTASPAATRPCASSRAARWWATPACC